ncbi:hypothetical protein [Nocardiopsis composta]|uniref:Uncharacterized protein n=1 Tax=Nocardiopsis composta TaxID=157465 RepID=A0A7W8VBT3_9ACTN|nr:hypothetical protein [Nocardiopsis composta]MBB5430467.1 hypothetical protein [Nocardiopsis composta]
MSDMYELLVSADLPGDLAGAEAGELRWHLGLGPRPERRVIVGEFPEAVIGDDGRPVQDGRGGLLVEDRPRALLAQRGPAHRIGGALMAAMERRPGGGWALSARQEIHPDDRDLLDVLLLWLRTRSGGGPAFRCTARFCEEESFEPLALPEPPAAARGTA